MKRLPFIFSDRLRYKILRHSLFWLAWIISQMIIFVIPYVYSNRAGGRIFLQQFLANVVFLLPHMILVYSLLYFILPRFVTRNRYGLAILWAIGLSLFAVAVYETLDYTIVNAILVYFEPARATKERGMQLNLLTIGVLFFWGLYGCITVSAIALTIKLLKLWFNKEQKNIQLQRENFISKTRLLQSQIHPHFLFNTLNNIYSSAMPAAPAASQMIMRLSSLLRYILYECNKPAVPLEKEFDMIREYIALESMRYDEKLEITIDMPERANEYLIAPLLLLPFVENCFKHGTSTIIEKPWINLHVQLKDEQLFVKLVNGKAPDPAGEERLQDGKGLLDGKGLQDGSGRRNGDVYVSGNGIGIANVQSRLDLLYPGKHELKVIHEPELFGISLRVELDKTVPSH